MKFVSPGPVPRETLSYAKMDFDLAFIQVVDSIPALIKSSFDLLLAVPFLTKCRAQLKHFFFLSFLCFYWLTTLEVF